MNSTWGRKYRLSVFGESHGKGVGVVIDGLPAGFAVDFDAVSAELSRRAPGRDETSTPRRESDRFEVFSGIMDGKTTGAPLMAMTRNADTRSGDYTPGIPRPGHADLVAMLKYRNFNDFRGGGHFSGRLTAAIVFAGAIAKQILASRHGVAIISRAASIHGETDPERQRAAVLEARARGDSVGGVIECIVTGVPVGWGEPIFHSAESELAAMMFSIPAVKGVEFGDGFGFADKYGSEVSDGLGIDANGNVMHLANHNGGINGGITNGETVVFRVAVKPTPTISIPQKTVNLNTNEAIVHSFSGRHDPCIVPRALPVVECAAAIALMECGG
ncbi:MAG: chorismate synthase [Oscillospiraceae bacterium]|jgi:chorismate synthase|nr:chorismate synthase [Oscillospiraceae bacterium]